jgi:mRNA-degrading endonuclease RelE of RelBE toxin-antitoxin system
MSVDFVVNEEGQPVRVLLDMADYERLLDRAEDAESTELLRRLKEEKRSYVSLDELREPLDSEISSHQVSLDKRAANQLNALDDGTAGQLAEQLSYLGANPRPRECRKVLGTRRVFRLAHGDYRILYSVDDDENAVYVHAVGHRQQVYQSQ